MAIQTILSPMASNLDIHAIAHFTKLTLAPTLLAHTILALSLAFIPPSSHLPRLFATGLTIALCMESIRRCSLHNYEQSSFADYMFGLAFHTNCYLILLNRNPPAELDKPLQKLQWGANALFSPRMGIKPHRRDPPSMTKRHFLLRRLAVFLTLSTVWLTIRTGTTFHPTKLTPTDWSPSKTHLLPQLLSHTLRPRDLQFRLSLAFYAYAGSALTINLAHTFCALVAVGVFNSPHEDWPPLFGNILEAYTLRRWYSHFWHKAMRKAFTIHAVVVTEKFLGLRKHTIGGRSVILLLSFLFSGIMHTVTSDLGDSCSEWFGAVGLFMGFAGAILAEQAVQAAYSWLHDGVLKLPWTRAEMVFWRGVGYCWVAYYLLEFTIAGSFRFLQCAQAEDEGAYY